MIIPNNENDYTNSYINDYKLVCSFLTDYKKICDYNRISFNHALE